MARALLLAILLLTGALAGCMGDEAEPSSPAGPDDDPGSDPSDGGTGTPDPDTEPQPPRARTPTWIPGQAWTWQVESQVAEPFEVTTVVAETTPEVYRVGITNTTQGLRALVLHLPPFGDIQREDLGAWWHGDTVSFLDFPLTDGKTWTKEFQGEELTYTAEATRGPVLQADGPRFEITGVDADGARRIEAVYAPGVAHFLEIHRYFPGDETPFTTARLTELTLGYRGEVHVPTFTDLLEAQATGPSQAGMPQLSPPAPFTVPEATTHLVLAAFMGGAEGLYSTTFQPPGGGPIHFQTQNPPGETDVELTLAIHTNMTGQWTAQLTPVGQGVIFAEAIGVQIEPRSL